MVSRWSIRYIIAFILVFFTLFRFLFFLVPEVLGELSPHPGDKAARKAYDEKISGIFLTVKGRVIRILQDDIEGTPHQRFIIRLNSGQTILVSHNLQLAPRAPIRIGLDVEVRGKYEWNKKGGILHFTHHDPKGGYPGGWVEVRGKRYR